MSDFATRLTRAPIPFDADAGAEVAARFSDQPGDLRALLAGAAGCAPFLKTLMETQEDWLRPCLGWRPSRWQYPPRARTWRQAG